jgi:hypothetical protein
LDLNLPYNPGWGRSQEVYGEDSMHTGKMGSGARAAKAICTEVGPGLPGSSQERERAAIIARELESHLGAGNVVVEEFTAAPGGFLGWTPWSALLTLVAALLNISMGRFTGVSPWLTAIAALALSIIAVLPVISKFIFYFEFVDPLFKKKQSVNVIGTLRKHGSAAERAKARARVGAQWRGVGERILTFRRVTYDENVDPRNLAEREGRREGISARAHARGS